MRQLLIAITLLLSMIFPTLSQNARSDFSGTWVLNLAKSKLEPHSFVVSSTMVIKCLGTTVEIDDTTNGKKQSPWIYTTDGKEHFFQEVPGGDELAKATWEKSVLVTRLIGRKARPPFDFTDRWTLSSDGRTLTQQSTGRVKQTFVYDRQ
jgi:hypothetical protein